MLGQWCFQFSMFFWLYLMIFNINVFVTSRLQHIFPISHPKIFSRSHICSSRIVCYQVFFILVLLKWQYSLSTKCLKHIVFCKAWSILFIGYVSWTQEFIIIRTKIFINFSCCIIIYYQFGSLLSRFLCLIAVTFRLLGSLCLDSTHVVFTIGYLSLAPWQPSTTIIHNSK